jgi:hypothetical protein
MKKIVSVAGIVVLMCMLFITQAFAKAPQTPQSGSASAVKATPTALTDGSDTLTGQTQGKGQKPDKALKHSGKKYNYKGEVASFDGTTLVITLKNGAEATLTVDENTVLKFPGHKDATVELQEGDQVAAQAVKTEDESYLALRVTVIPGKPERVHRVGTVTEYTEGESIMVEAKDGSTTTFKIAPDVKILPAERADSLKVGSFVTVISPRDVAGGEVIAAGIVVHPDKSDSGD